MTGPTAAVGPGSARATTRGRLYLVPNALDLGTAAATARPLSDTLPLGVLRTAARLEHWLAENAKSARAFLKRVDAEVALQRPLQALAIAELPRPRKGSDPARGDAASAAALIAPLLAPALAGHDQGLISEAGLPAVADPGAAVVEAAHRSGIEVVALPGPSALTLALAASGLNGQQFAFVGYLPTAEAERATRLRELEALSRRLGQAQVFIETPYRNAALWSALLQTLQPGTRLHVSCGLSLDSGFSRTRRVQEWRGDSLALPNDVPAVFAIQGG